MDNVKSRLVTCFKTVFPELSDEDTPTATTDSLQAWDSVATITLMNVVEDEFKIDFDLERLSEVDSFERVYEYVKSTQPAS